MSENKYPPGENWKAFLPEPREPSPELAEAEEWLTDHDEGFSGTHISALARSLRNELYRLRAETARLREQVARLQSSPSSLVYVPAKDDNEALDTVANKGFFLRSNSDSTCAIGMLADGQCWHVVELRAKGVKP